MWLSLTKQVKCLLLAHPHQGSQQSLKPSLLDRTKIALEWESSNKFLLGIHWWMRHVAHCFWGSTLLIPEPRASWCLKNIIIVSIICDDDDVRVQSTHRAAKQPRTTIIILYAQRLPFVQEHFHISVWVSECYQKAFSGQWDINSRSTIKAYTYP